LLKSDSESDSDIDLMSSSEEEKEELQILPATVPSYDSQLFGSQTEPNPSSFPSKDSKKQIDTNVVLKNKDQWKLEETDPNNPNPVVNASIGESGDLWKKLQTRDSLNKKKGKG